MLRGIIKDAETHKPLMGANVIAPDGGTASNAFGEFSLKTKFPDSVRVHFIGYESLHLEAETGVQVLELKPITIPGIICVVQSGYRPESRLEQSASISVLPQARLEQAGEGFFENIIQEIPNLNFAGGTSRPRYFQIRGIGERSQYAGEGAPVFSVGYLMDEFDLTGISVNTSLFDVDQVEVYRGPQSSVYGPSAYGGLIHTHTADPLNENTLKVKTLLGSHGQRQISMVASHSLFGGKFAHRLSVSRNQEDGDRENVYHLRSDLNGKNEMFYYYRSRIRFTPHLFSHFSLLHSLADNGYDAWSPDNERVSYADDPGKDKQALQGLALTANWTPIQHQRLFASFSRTQSAMEYSYDGDWGNNDYWQEDPYLFDPEVEGWEYSFYDETKRTRITEALELRWIQEYLKHRLRFTVGVYSRHLEEEDEAVGWLFGGDDYELNSMFDLSSVSTYGQLEYELSPRINLLNNFRYESRTTIYADDNEVDYELKNDLYGWKSSLTYAHSQRLHSYFTIARGYKGGGVNQHPRLAVSSRPYNPEHMYNFETGLRWAGPAAFFSATAFYAKRHNQQVNLSRQQDGNDPNSFVYFTSNAGGGYQSGLEVESEMEINSLLSIDASLALLQTYVDAYTFNIDTETTLQLGDRAIAQAPPFGYKLGLNLMPMEALQLGLSLSGKDAFYFSDSHDQISPAYSLLNTRLSYQWRDVELTFWVNNILDREYAVRGFYFGLEPPDYEQKLYTQLGAPRRFGVTMSAVLR